GWDSYYSRGISDPLLSPEPRRRARRGSVERPVNGRLYRVAWLAVALPALLLAFTVSRPSPLPRPALPPPFDGRAAASPAPGLQGARGDDRRSRGSPADLDSAQWVEEQMSALGLRATDETFDATIPGAGKVRLHNVVTVVEGRSPQTIVVMAHRDNA